MTDQQEFEDTMGAALDAVQLNDPDRTMHALADLTALGEPALRAAALRLAADGADLIRRLLPDQGHDSTDSPDSTDPTDSTRSMVELRLTDVDGSTVTIDDLEPTLRSAIRMVLSLVNGGEASVMEQLDLVCGVTDDSDEGQLALASVVIQLLMWTTQLDEHRPGQRPWH
ncbi:MAG TPA: hypothetical protein VHX38_01785 [Pseudonocardiaceae bacterium]|jgi:hypothetical protein|nr:hypothetical protein [Pseudonocardiaceae bacterium]